MHRVHPLFTKKTKEPSGATVVRGAPRLLPRLCAIESLAPSGSSPSADAADSSNVRRIAARDDSVLADYALVPAVRCGTLAPEGR